MSKDSKKQQIIEAVNKYVNDDILDITEFRKNNPEIYATLPYYFGGVNKMLDELGLIKVQKSQQKNKMTLRNRLAYDMLTELRKGHTLEQIANKYDVTRALINQLYQALDRSAKIEELEKQKELIKESSENN